MTELGQGIKIGDELISITQRIRKNISLNKDKDTYYVSNQTLRPQDVEVKVEGVGRIGLNGPMNFEEVQALIKLSTEAKFGLGDKTVLDKEVRNTQEISHEKLQVKIEPQILKDLLANVRDDFGLSENITLSAHLHNMLVYAPGQFFKRHQDTEKLEGMVATMVLVLPYSHIGGNLVIMHQNNKFTFESQALDPQNVKCIAFYADCEHELDAVTQGYRVALTFNIVMNSEKQDNVVQDLVLQNMIKSYFANANHDTLTYLLDHSYSERGLRWPLLKGSDFLVAKLFKKAAKDLGLVPYLALVECHESWANDGFEDSPELMDFIESSVNLIHLLDKNDKKLKSNMWVNENEICFIADNSEKEPDEKEYEGYTGNAGCTSDYWYKRAAIILIEESKEIEMSFKFDRESALQNLFALTQKKGNEARALNIVTKAQDFINARFYSKDFEKIAHICIYISDAELARRILSEFTLSILCFENVGSLAKLEKMYTVEWLLKLLEGFINQEYTSMDSQTEKNIDKFTSDVLRAGISEKFASTVLKYHIDKIMKRERISKYSTLRIIKEYMPSRFSQLFNTVNACVMLSEQNVLEPLLEHVIAQSELYPPLELVKIFYNTELKKNQDGYNLLKNHLICLLEKELAKGHRSENDFSITCKKLCKCEHCKELFHFLESPQEVEKIMSIVMHLRKHVLDVWENYGLPLDFSILKKGSPHKLVINKHLNMYQEDKQKFEQLQIAYEKLLNSQKSVLA